MFRRHDAGCGTSVRIDRIDRTIDEHCESQRKLKHRAAPVLAELLVNVDPFSRTLVTASRPTAPPSTAMEQAGIYGKSL